MFQALLLSNIVLVITTQHNVPESYPPKMSAKVAPWRRDLLEKLTKLTVTLLVINDPPFLVPGGSSPFSQGPTTLDPILSQTNPHPVSLRPALILSFNLGANKVFRVLPAQTQTVK
jgi:hypothetical protein